MPGPVKRSVTLAGHRTSVSLEPIFWSLLEAQAAQSGLSINQFVLQIDAGRTTNLSSAIRTYLVEQLVAHDD
jgi:predicted DNA-binding ribbon-helix-helix protein